MRDADNLSKAILDLLTAHSLIEDDAPGTSVTSRWDPPVPPGTVRITVAGITSTLVKNG